MLFCEFYSLLRQLNPNLKIDCEREVVPYHQDFPMAGMYHGSKYLMGVNHGDIYEDSIFGVNKEGLRAAKISMPEDAEFFVSPEVIEKVKVSHPDFLQERVLARGYRFILSKLCQLGIISRDRAERLFGVTLCPNRPDMAFPRRYLAMEF